MTKYLTRNMDQFKSKVCSKSPLKLENANSCSLIIITYISSVGIRTNPTIRASCNNSQHFQLFYMASHVLFIHGGCPRPLVNYDVDVVRRAQLSNWIIRAIAFWLVNDDLFENVIFVFFLGHQNLLLWTFFIYYESFIMKSSTLFEKTKCVL